MNSKKKPSRQPEETKVMEAIRGKVKPEFQHSGNKIKNGTMMINFGRYRDKYTFSDLFEKDPSYCRWFVNANKTPTDHMPE